MNGFNQNKITKKERNSLVREKLLKEVELSSIDIKRLNVEYEDENLIFSDFRKLDNFLEYVFIPKKLAYKTKFNKETGEDEKYLLIEFNKILALRLSEEEVRHTVYYLQKQGIRVEGYNSTLAREIEGYEDKRNYKECPLPQFMSKEEQMNLFIEYQMIEDKSSDYAREIRNKIAIGNMRLVSIVAYKYSIATGLDIHELESYGYEGLLIAIEKFNSSNEYSFASYATPIIKRNIQNGFPELFQIKNGYFYNCFIKCKIMIESALSEQYGTKVTLDKYPELRAEVLKLMVYQGMISKKWIDDYNSVLNISFCDDLENYHDMEDDFDIDEIVIKNTLMKEDLNEAISYLTYQEEEVIRSRFGLNSSGECKLLEEIGKEFGKTGARVHQIEKKALKKLRHPDISKGLHIYLEN